MNQAERASIIIDLEHYAAQLQGPGAGNVLNWTTPTLLRKRLLRIAELVRQEGEQQDAAATSCPNCVDLHQRLVNTRRVLWTAARGVYPQPLVVPRVAVPQSTHVPDLLQGLDQATGDLLLIAALPGETDHLEVEAGEPHRIALTDTL